MKPVSITQPIAAGPRDLSHAPARGASRPGAASAVRRPLIWREGAQYVYEQRKERRAAQSGTATMLAGLIEKMGGAATSASKGSFLSVSV